MAMPSFPLPFFFLHHSTETAKRLSKPVGENWEMEFFCSFWKNARFRASDYIVAISFRCISRFEQKSGPKTTLASIGKKIKARLSAGFVQPLTERIVIDTLRFLYPYIRRLTPPLGEPSPQVTEGLAYHLPFVILPATRMEPNTTIAIMIVIHIGEKTQSHDQERTFVSFKRRNNMTKAPTRPIHLLLFFL